jgi:hypothetical protein
VRTNDFSILEGATQASWSFWFKINVMGNSQTFLAKFSTNSSNDSWTIRVPTSGLGAGNEELSLYFSASVLAWTAGAGGTGNFSPNKWYHATFTYDASQPTNATKVKLYLNGAQKTLNYLGTIPSSLAATNSDVTIGGLYTSVLSQFLNGSLDDVRIYNRALSASEIKQIYNQSVGSKVNASSQTDSTTSLNTGLVGWWTFDSKNLKSNVADSSGQGNTGYLTGFGATSTAVTAGKLGQGLKFDGVNDYVTRASPTNLDHSFITVSAWVKPQRFVANGAIVARSTVSGNTGGFQFTPTSATTGAVTFWASISGTWRSSPSANGFLEKNKWVHAVVTYDGNYVRTYKNGILNVTPSAWPGTIDAAGSPNVVNIGKHNNAAAYFDGIIDDVRVYSRAFSASEVKQLYNQSVGSKVNASSQTDSTTSLNTGLVGWWTFDSKNLKSNVADSSGQNNTGYLTGFGATSTAVTAGKIGQGLKFDGVDDNINTNMTTDETNGLSISFWARNNKSGTAQQTFVSKGGTSSGFYYFCYAFGNRLLFSKEGATDLYARSSVDFGAMPVGQWMHIVMTWDGSDSATYGVKFYKNNVLIAHDFDTAGVSLVSGSTRTVNIGARGGTANFVIGTMDDVRIYNRALSASEIKQLYNMGR